MLLPSVPPKKREQAMKTRSHPFSSSFKRILRGTLYAAFLATAVTASPVTAQDRGDRSDRDSGSRGEFGGRGSMMMMGGGGMGGFDPSSMLSRFDRNGNKMLDPDETQGPAGFFLQRMAQSNPKIDLSKPIPLETIAGEFERMRQERMGGSSFGGGSPWGGGQWGGSQWGGSQWGGSPQGEQEQSGPKPLVPTFGIPVPPASVRTFGSTDSSEPAVAVTDRDLREAEDRMGRYDRNKDGFLSADELSGGRWSDDPMQYDRNGDGKLSKEELAVRYAKRRIAEEQQQQGQGDQNSGGDSRFGSRSMMFMGGGGMSGGMMGFGGGGEGGGDRGDRGDRGGERGKEEKTEAKRPKSLRQLSTREKTDKEAGKPDWFTRDDKDTDGQISMAEFSSNWDEGTIADFAKFDLNTDGFITTLEVRKAIANGASRSGGSSRSSSSMASSSRRSSSTETRSPETRGPETRPADSASSSAANSGETKSEMPAVASNEVAATPATTETKPTTTTESTSTDDPKLKRQIEWASKQIAKYDKNGDGALTPNEYSEMPIPPKNEWDFDGDGRITAEEYARGRK